FVVDDQPGVVFTDFGMTAKTHRRGRRPGTCHQHTVEFSGSPGGATSPAARRRLHYHRAPRQCCDQPVTDEEPGPEGDRAWRPLCEHESPLGDPLEQTGVPQWIDGVYATGEYHHSPAVGSQGPTMCGGVDAISAPGNHGPSGIGETVGQLGSQLESVRCG